METQPDIVFYDGDCALCHGVVRFVLPRDRRAAFVFAPLGGQTFSRVLGTKPNADLPDSILVRRADGSVLVRSQAVMHIARSLGGVWALLARIARIFPRGLRDWAYNRIAAVRRRWFGRPAGACPLVPPELRPRLLP